MITPQIHKLVGLANVPWRQMLHAEARIGVRRSLLKPWWLDDPPYLARLGVGGRPSEWQKFRKGNRRFFAHPLC